MNRLWLFGIVLMFAGFVMAPPAAQAAGFGVYGTGSVGVNFVDNSQEDPTRVYSVGAGIVFDSALAKDKLFNYRLNLGYSREFYGSTSPMGHIDTHTVTWSNTFGFGFYRRPAVRLWAGPSLSFVYQRYTLSNTSPFASGSELANILRLNIGAVVGVNANPGKLITIGWELGFQGGVGFAIDSGSSSNSINNIEVFTRLSVMFRVGDTFNPVAPKDTAVQ